MMKRTKRMNVMVSYRQRLFVALDSIIYIFALRSPSSAPCPFINSGDTSTPTTLVANMPEVPINALRTAVLHSRVFLISVDDDGKVNLWDLEDLVKPPLTLYES